MSVVNLPSGPGLEVVGESYHVAALQGLADDGQRDCWASLVPEPANPYDPNAVGVWINGAQVGYLSREHAEIFAPVAKRLIALGAEGRCAARIGGGGGRYGVRLDLGTPDQCLQALGGRAIAPTVTAVQPAKTTRKKEPSPMRYWNALFIIMTALTLFATSQSGSAGTAALVISVSVLLYFLPSYVATRRQLVNGGPVHVVNLFLGWTLIGWVAALAMAAGGKTIAELPLRPAPTKACPQCAEQVQVDARICRFCRADLTAATVATP